MNPKHSILKLAHYNQTSEYNIHYTKRTLNTPYKSQHITIKLHNTIYITQNEP